MGKRFITFGLILAAISISANATSLKGLKNAKISMVTPKEMKEILKKYPNHVELQGEVYKEVVPPAQDTKETAAPKASFTIQYRLGARIKNDFVIAYDDQFHGPWNSPLDVDFYMRYPAAGTGYTVTYATLHIYQSVTYNRAYLLEGGIGYDYIGLAIETDDTEFITTHIKVYGTN